MKLKGINVFEQHVEKFVLATAVLGVGGIAAWQFLSQPEVKVGTKSVPPGQVDKLLQAKADSLSAKLKSSGDSKDQPGVIKIPTDGVTLAADGFKSSLAGGVSPVPALAVTSPNFNGTLVAGSAAASDVWYYVPKVAALQMRTVQETADALTKESAAEAKKASPALAARPDFATIDGPKDVVWTTPVARIDLKALRAELARSNAEASPPQRQIPGVWYQETPYVVDVVFERRERKDGGWGDPQVVPVFAARSEELAFRGKLGGATADLRDEVFALLGSDENQKEILQPTFYETVNSAFVSPSVLADAGPAAAGAAPGTDAGAARRRMQLQTQLQQRQRRAETLRVEVEKLGGLWDEAAEKRAEEDRKRDEKERKDAEKGGGKTGGGGAGGGPGGGPGGSMSGRNNAQSDNSERDAKRKAAERKAKSGVLRKLYAEIAELEQELGLASTVPTATSKPVKAPSLASMDELLVWGHDLEVKPGRTYQYRCVARVYNPFFGKGNQLVKEQEASGLPANFTLDSAASDWSQPITVSPDVRYFVTRAIVGDGPLGSGSAQVEVYKLLGGQWKRAELSVQPGERIGKPDDRSGSLVDFGTDFYLVDVVEDLDPSRSEGSSRERRAGMAVIASMSAAGAMDIRVPADDLENPDRMRLKEQADAAKTAAATGDPADGSKDAGAPKGPGAPGGSGAPKGGGPGAPKGPGAG